MESIKCEIELTSGYDFCDILQTKSSFAMLLREITFFSNDSTYKSLNTTLLENSLEGKFSGLSLKRDLVQKNEIGGEVSRDVLELLRAADYMILNFINNCVCSEFEDLVMGLNELYLEIDNAKQSEFDFTVKKIDIIRLAQIVSKGTKIRHLSEKNNRIIYYNGNKKHVLGDIEFVKPENLLGGCLFLDGVHKRKLVFAKIDLSNLDNMNRLSENYVDGKLHDCFMRDKRLSDPKFKGKIKIIPGKAYDVECRILKNPAQKKPIYYVEKINLEEFMD